MKKIYQKLKNYLTQKFLVNISERESYKRRHLFEITPGIILSIIAATLFISFLSAWLLLSYTPARTFIPGYTAQDKQNRELLEQQLVKMEKIIAERDSFIQLMQALPNILTKDSTTNHLETSQFNFKEPLKQPKYYKYNQQNPILPTSLDLAPADSTNNSKSIYSLTNQSKPIHLFPPVEGFLTSQYSENEPHYAIDLVAPENSLIRAVAEGFVIFAEYSIQTGYVIAIQHPNQMISFYKHNAQLLKTIGSYVQSAESIAILGNSGEQSQGPHLHFELWQNGLPINPLHYLNYKQQ